MAELNSQDQNKQQDSSFDLPDEIADWSDLRKFDDDHDSEWFKFEENKLADQYGGKFIKVKYTSQGRVGYFCELCLAECNAKKSLELHCAGMKHLKKKDIWEREGKKPFEDLENPLGPVPPSFKAPEKKKPPAVPNPRTERPWNPPANQEVHPWSVSPWSSGRAPFGSNHKEEKVLNWGYSRDFNAAPPRPPPFQESASRRSTSPPYGRRRPYSPYSRRSPSPYARSKSPVYDYGYGNDRKQGRRSPRRSRSPGDKYSRRSRSPPDRSNKRRSSSASRDKRSPSPSKKESLSSSPAGTLLKKLSECCVKTEGDADLALSVIAALSKSLKDYCFNNGQVKISELLMEVQLKIGTVKALKAGMKLLNSATQESFSKEPNNPPMSHGSIHNYGSTMPNYPNPWNMPSGQSGQSLPPSLNSLYTKW